MVDTRKVYFAGELFSLKDLIGNAVLAAAINEESEGRYSCVLPQALEQRETTAKSIRDQDIKTLMQCDVGLFNFDGTEIDSGTVVEYMIAKFLDIPSVIVRSDFRLGGDSGGDPWNLMMSFYPRTKVILTDGMGDYQSELSDREALRDDLKETAKKSIEAVTAAVNALALRVISSFDEVVHEVPLLPKQSRNQVYGWAQLMPGNDFRKRMDTEALEEILKRKVSMGLL